MRHARLITAPLALSILLGCASHPQGLRERVREIPAKSFSSYVFDAAAPVMERVRAAPEFLLRYLRESEPDAHFSPYMPSREELAGVEYNLSLLPKSYTDVLNARLIGIYFISGWTGAGMSDYVLDGKNNLYFILILNPEVLGRDISDWVTYREKTCYLPPADAEKNIDVKIDCGKEYTGLTYALLHETSHLADYVNHYTPYVEDNIRELGLGVQETPFTTPVWKEYGVPLAGNGFTLRKELAFYGLKRPAIHLSNAVTLYQSLEKTPFCSLYGAQNWAEDFAEYMCMYYLAKILHQPYTIEVRRDGRLEYSYSPMESARVLERAKSVLKALE